LCNLWILIGLIDYENFWLLREIFGGKRITNRVLKFLIFFGEIVPVVKIFVGFVFVWILVATEWVM